MGTEIILIMWIGGEWFFGSRGHEEMEECEAKAQFYKLPHVCLSRDELMQKLQKGQPLHAPD